MILELVMLVYGLLGFYALIHGRFWLGWNNVATGAKARTLGVLCLSLFPLSILTVLILSLALLAIGVRPDTDTVVFTSIFIEAGVLLTVLWFLNFLGVSSGLVPARIHIRSSLILFLAILGCTGLEVMFCGYSLGPEMSGAAVWGLCLGSLGGVAFGMCAASELRRQAKLPAEVA